MEGMQGITLEIPAAVQPVATMPKGTESPVTTQPSDERLETETMRSEPEGTGEKRFEKSTESSDKTPTTEQQNKETTNEKEPDPFAELKEQIKNDLERLGERAGPETIDMLLDDYLDELLSQDEKKDSEKRLVDTFAELIRLLKILIALLLLASKPNYTGTYSGKDLNLSDTPPEGDENNPITKILNNGEDSRESWKKFKEDVEKVENVPFSILMTAALEANSKYSVKKVTLKGKKEDKLTSLKNKLKITSRRREMKPKRTRSKLTAIV